MPYSTDPDQAHTCGKINNKCGAKMASELDYVPLPESLIKQVRATWKSDIKGVPAIAAK